MRPAFLAPAVLAAVLGLTAGCSAQRGDPNGLGTPEPAPQPTTRTGEPAPSAPSPSVAPTTRAPGRPHVVGTVATGLAAPWGVTFLPDGSALVGERDTTRVVAIEHGRVRTVGRVEGVRPQGEAGLLGLAASPSYARDHLVYAYLSTATDNRVVTMRYDGQRLGAPKPVLTGIPNGFVHDGGRLLFAPDGNLFVSTGETGQGSLAQDRELARRQDPAHHTGRQTGAGQPARRGRRCGRWGTATCRAWRSTPRAGCGPPSSARTPGTS